MEVDFIMRQIDMEGIGHFVHSNGDETLTIIIRVALTEDINTSHMQTALEKAAQRYPNFHSVLASSGNGLVYELSDDKPVLLTGDKKRKLASKELHGFPYCVSCEGNMLKLSVHHGITDGYGATEFVKTLLYYYLKECGKPVTADGEIRLLETPYNEEAEDEMSYLKYYDKSIVQEQPQLGGVKLFALPVEYWDEAGRYEFRRFKLSLSAKQVVGFARECGSSATGLINAIVCKAFQKAYDLEGKLLINSLTSNFRHLLPSDSMHNFSGWFLSFYTPEMQGMTLGQTAAVMKGMIAQNNTEQNALKIISERSTKGLEQRKMPLDEIFADKPDCMIEKKAVRQSMGSIITNVGALDIPESMKPWVGDMEFYIPALTAPIVFGINAFGDAFTVSVVQSFEDDKLVKAFCEVCSENGLEIICRDMGTEVLDTLEKDAVRIF